MGKQTVVQALMITMQLDALTGGDCFREGAYGEVALSMSCDAFEFNKPAVSTDDVFAVVQDELEEENILFLVQPVSAAI